MNINFRLIRFFVLLILISLPIALRAEVGLPSIFGDHMVLQRGKPIPVWGTAAKEEQVTVTLGKQSRTATADADGHWRVTFKAIKGRGPLEMTVSGKNAITIHDILIGDVWICSGQSNMEFWLKAAKNGEEEVKKAEYPNIRLFTVKKNVADKPQVNTAPDTKQNRWEACSAATAGDFTAVGYFFGRELHKKLGVPIGLVHTSWGGTPAESWTTRATLEASADFKPIVERWDAAMKAYPQAQANFEKDLAQWRKEAEAAKKDGKPEPKRPNPPLAPGNPNTPAGLYNGMIAPLVPLAAKGFIWYQGESNAGRAYQYRKLFPAMIQDWRKSWGDDDMPFFFVQLANFLPRKDQPADSEWAELREAQTMTLSLEHTGMAVIIDVGEEKDIHPKNKQDVGRRLALAALGTEYEKHNPLVFWKNTEEYSGPMFKKMSVEGNKVRLKFNHVGKGLVSKSGGDSVKGFAVAGEDKKFVWADAKIDGSSVWVHSDQVAHPVAVRYAWADNPDAELFNTDGLPASPFRTDDWPGLTAERK